MYLTIFPLSFCFSWWAFLSLHGKREADTKAIVLVGHRTDLPCSLSLSHAELFWDRLSGRLGASLPRFRSLSGIFKRWGGIKSKIRLDNQPPFRETSWRNQVCEQMHTLRKRLCPLLSTKQILSANFPGWVGNSSPSLFLHPAQPPSISSTKRGRQSFKLSESDRFGSLFSAVCAPADCN